MSGRQRNIRKRRALDEEEEEGEQQQPAAGGEGEQEQGGGGLSVEDTKLLQKQRQRRTGIDASSLAVADTAPRLADVAAGAAGPDVLVGAFKKEKRQAAAVEDPHMKKYIEEQLARRLGRPQDAAQDAAQPSGQPGGADVPLPESLRARQVDTELAPTWVTGILEVPLSLEHKLKNIEETEAAKKRMLAAGAARLGEDEDEDGAGGGEQGLRRGMYPVHFGRQREGEAERLQASRARKQHQREVAREKKLKKKQEFQGW